MSYVSYLAASRRETARIIREGKSFEDEWTVEHMRAMALAHDCLGFAYQMIAEYDDHEDNMDTTYMGIFFTEKAAKEAAAWHQATESAINTEYSYICVPLWGPDRSSKMVLKTDEDTVITHCPKCKTRLARTVRLPKDSNIHVSCDKCD